MVSLKNVCCESMNDYLVSHRQLSEIEKVRVKYGVEMFYLAFSKTVVIALIAGMLGVLPGMLLAMISFNLIKSSAYGLHAKSSMQCLLMSFLGLVLLPMLWRNSNPNIILLHSITVLMPLYFYIFAPSDTVKRPLIGATARAGLRLKATKRTLFIGTLIICIPSVSIKVYLLSGLLTQAVLNCPITYYLMNEKRRNYEEFEK
ncbi:MULTISPECIES: accessory gene regulator B family protein [unclassified Fusibacter]|uniref:accessory gene regulator B family protein n=1 Tax=unclassified Fusibacter TaxID=2624464 RepID=UPI001011AED3|nr:MULTISPECIES: accessory gene regulator B family protein [unclassified Fusibacter]MCK8058218.1 accessory gene regulator B family protein [Fusibacter sp. A2]NPE20801.1 hypothetical protein [Fusibacter sp. A1]RXV63006.1 hypothetical protein DWB64_03135 [Fusibacter sp. A1]